MSEIPLWKRYQAQLDALAKAQLNFDLEKTHEYTEANGWYIDEYEAELPAEPPGPPVPGNSWEMARQIMREYKFADPDIITGIYYPDRPLEERVMLLRGKFLFLTFYFGVRIGSVTDGRRETPEGLVQVWGFNYQTLQGHFEKGQMDFEVWKWLDSGKVAFRIEAFSKPDVISNPFYRLGFKLFGRKLQRKFAHRAMERMQHLVRQELAAQVERKPAPDVEAPSIQPASTSPEAEEQLEAVEEQLHEEAGE